MLAGDPARSIPFIASMTAIMDPDSDVFGQHRKSKHLTEESLYEEAEETIGETEMETSPSSASDDDDSTNTAIPAELLEKLRRTDRRLPSLRPILRIAQRHSGLRDCSLLLHRLKGLYGNH